MRRLVLAVVAFAVLVLAGPLAAQPVRGLIVKLRDGQASSNPAGLLPRELVASVARAEGIELRGQAFLGRKHHVLRLARPLEGASLDAALRRLRLRPEVASVEPDVLLKRLAVPNDPGYAQQWHLQSPAAFASALDMPAAWDRSTGLPGVTVALVDSGIVKSDLELAGRFWPGYDFVSDPDIANDGDGRDADASDPGDWVSAADVRTPAFRGCIVEDSSWHGTFIAGQIAAVTNNLQGIAGINWNNRVLPVRVAGKCGALLSDLLAGVMWAAGLQVDGAPVNPNSAKIINISFGGDVACNSGTDTAYQDAIDAVTAAGSLVVVAGGNGYGAQLRRPADCRGVLAVGAVRQDGLKEDYSSVGPGMGLMAPGGPLYSLSNTGTLGPVADSYDLKEGTSFSAPLAAGVASLMLSLNPALTPARLIVRMRAAARPHIFNSAYATCSNHNGVNTTCNCTVDTCGAGLLDANNATRLALAPVAIAQAPATVAAGAVVTLDGRASAAATGSQLTAWQWSQVSGPAVFVAGSDQALASVSLPSQTATFGFQLVVADDSGRTDAMTVTVTAGTGGGSGDGGGTGGAPATGGGTTGWLWSAGLWLLAGLAWCRRGRARAA